MEYPQELLDYVDKHPHIHTIYFNSKGEYVFRPSNQHLMSKTRAEVMGTTKKANDKK